MLDVAFNATGSMLATASMDNTARIYNKSTGACKAVLEGHKDEVNTVKFNPQGDKVLTTSNDKTARLWSAKDGTEL